MENQLSMEQILQGRTPYRFPYRTGLMLWVEFPPGWQQQDKRPAMVTIHGGGFNSGSPWYLWPQCRYFAARGCVSIGIEYRLTQNGVQLEDAVKDCRCAIRTVRRNAQFLGIDPDRICLLGESAGGYLALACALMDDMDHPGDLTDVSCSPNLLIDVNGIADMTGVWYDRCRNILPATITREDVKKFSPLHRVHPGLPKLITFHGVKDTVVDPHDSQRLTQAWIDAGNAAHMLPSPEAGHAFLLFYEPKLFQGAFSATQMLDDCLTKIGILQPRKQERN